MWMKNGKNNKIKEQFKAKRSTTDHTLLPGSPAVHLVSLCLICGHLWCALSLSSHLVHLLRVQTTICAPFLLTQGARPLALPAAGRRCRQASSHSPVRPVFGCAPERLGMRRGCADLSPRCFRGCVLKITRDACPDQAMRKRVAQNRY